MRKGGSIAAAALLGCQTLIGADFDQAKLRQDEGSSCDSARPPGPPSVSGTPGDVELIAVITSLDYGDEADATGTRRHQSIGYDVDDRCTNRGDPPECEPPEWTDGDPTDGPRGQDNGVGRMLAVQEEVFGLAAITSSTESAGIVAGSRTSPGVIRLSGYSGFSDDEEVRVEWYKALPFSKGPAGSDGPKLDGSDEWPLAASAPLGTEPVRFVAETAYVSGHTLVARFSRMELPLANVTFDVRDMVLTAKLAPEPGKPVRRMVDGVVAGHSAADDQLRVVPLITFSVFGLELCTDNPNYRKVKRYICGSADLPLDPAASTGPCDGISFALEFQTHPAKLGPAIPLEKIPAPCPAEADPGRDTCAVPPP
jgi:hypothetical protein